MIFNIFSKYNYKLIALTAFLLLFSAHSLQLHCQDLFGILPVSPSGYITKSKVAANGNIYITVWGAGVYRSTDKGLTWNSVSTGLTTYNVTDIEFISANEILVATMGAGVFRTNSTTTINWVQTNQGLDNLNVKAIKTYSNGWVLIGTYGSGVYLSKNKGDNWTTSNKGLNYKDITSIETADNGWIVAGTFGGGIFLSRDTSKTWNRQSGSMKNQFIHDIKRNKLGYLYAASNGRGVYISVNDGIAWAELDTFMTRTQGIDPVPIPDFNATCITFNKTNNPVYGTRFGGIYAEDKDEDFTWIPTRLRGTGVTTMCQNTDNMYGFFPKISPHTSNNVGEEWTELKSATLEALGKYTGILSLKEKELIIWYDNIVKLSTDEGKTWTTSAPAPARINKVVKDSSGKYLAGTANGLYSSVNLATWTTIKSEVAPRAINIIDIEIAPNGTRFVSSRISGEMYDTSIVYYSIDGNVWPAAPIPVSFSDIKTPPFYDVAINYNGNAYITAKNILFFSTNNGLTWDSTKTPTLGDIVNVGFFSDNTVLIATSADGLFKSTGMKTFQKIISYPNFASEIMYIDRNDNIYVSGKRVLVDAAFANVEATYISTDHAAKFVNINKDFYAENVGNFTVNNVGDMYMSTSSGIIYRSVDRKNLSVPQLVDIPDKSFDVDVDALFKWTSAKRAELYQLQISYDEDFNFVWEGVTQSDTSHNLYAKLDPNHKYFWRVRAKNHEAVGDWSSIRTFMSKLKTPVLISPENKAVDVPVYANLLWEKIEGATNYRIQISKKSDMSEITYDWNSDTNVTKSALLEGLTEYFWRVKANNSVSTSDWSVIWSFKTVFGPPLLISPADKSKGNEANQLMVWGKATDINEYDIQISEKEDFSSVIMDSSAIAANSVTSYKLNYDKTYYWRVRSRNGSVYSEWSLVWSFRTGYSPVSLTLPAFDAVNVAINTEFKWDKHPSQNKYEIEVAKSADFSNNVIFEPVNNLLTYTATNLEAYQEYFWRVRVISDENTGVWSTVFKFKTQVDKIGLRFPANQSVNQPISINFLWFVTKGAVKYHLQIANDNEFNDLVFSQDTISNVSHNYPLLNPGSDYYWRVRGISPEGVGPWSEVWKFSTGNNIPVLILPANGDINVFNPIKFQWAAVGGALRFELLVSENENFSPNAIDKNDITDNEFTTSVLGFPKTFFWKIRAVTNEGPTSWSQVWTFTTKDPSSVRDIITLTESEIYPNPADKSVKIKLSETVNSDVHFKILDMSGKTVYSANKMLNSDILNWDCSGLNPGLYFFVIQSSDKIFKGEIIITR